MTLSGPTAVGLDVLRDLAFSPDGTILATAEGTSTTLWDVATRTKAATLTDTEIDPVGVVSLAFSPDGTILACGNLHATISLWDTVTHSGIATLVDPVGYTTTPRKGVDSIAFSPDGRALAGSTGDGLILLWGLTTRKLTTRFDGQTEVSGTVAYSPDGMMLAATLDHRLGLWRLG
ncbi:WD40 repeat domain-containing protein [Streptomyces sp. NPDC048291]|uniref:WD40 repeat domain-containing protein n=1 Tax=Streptomyces sp. NPDC048291 TaxID=3365530 RepID=UPI00371C0A96